MDRDMWPPLSVRNWQAVLGMRDSDWGSLEDDYDCIEAAKESRRLHELRGLVIAQVAEIEALLLYISSQIRDRSSPGNVPEKREKMRGAGNVLKDVEALLDVIGLGDDLSEQVETVRRTIRRRNDIVHATVHIGFAYVEFNDSRNSVICLLMDNDQIGQPRSEVQRYEEDEDYEFDEMKLECQLTDAYDALDRCVDIWVQVDSNLPNSM